MNNIQDGVYNAMPVTAAVYEKNNKLMLEVHFNLCDEQGTFFTQTGSNGKDYPIEKRKYYSLVSADGAVNTKTVDFIRAWAKGWDGTDPYWFTDAANLDAIGMVEVTLESKPGFNDPSKIYQNIEWVNPLGHNAAHSSGRKEIASDDRASIMAKYGAKFKAAAGAAAKPVAAAAVAVKPAPKAAPVAAVPARPAPVPKKPVAAVAAGSYPDGMAGQAKVWDEFANSDKAKAMKQADVEAAWFKAIDDVTGNGEDGSGKDQSEITGEEWGKISAALMIGF